MNHLLVSSPFFFSKKNIVKVSELHTIYIPHYLYIKHYLNIHCLKLSAYMPNVYSFVDNALWRHDTLFVSYCFNQIQNVSQAYLSENIFLDK